MVQEIINIAKNHYIHADRSFYYLLEETGYLTSGLLIDEKDIYNELIDCIDCIKYWLQWSENKRTSSGWFFLETNNGKYLVGFMPSDSFKEIIFTDKYEACAYFIMREIETIKKRINKI